MNESCSPGRILLVLSLSLLFSCPLSTVADAQDLPMFPGQDHPSRDCGCSRGDDTIPVSSGMLAPFLPKIPNLEIGFLYSFGNNVSTGRFTADYLLPFRLGNDSVLFGEAHAESWGFWKRPSISVSTPEGFTATTPAASNRIDLSFGGGYRTMLGVNTLVGVNGFYDTSRLFDTWNSSGGLGLEFASNGVGDDAIDANFNWYGNLFNRDVLVNAFRNTGNSFDLEAGYSHALFNQALDLRLKLAGYQFDVGDKVYGWRGGADLTTRDGVFTLRYEYGSDRLNGQYNTLGGFINIGFQLENLLSRESPFTLPEPVFKSPRDLRRFLALKVKRNWQQPAAVLSASTRCNLAGSVVQLAHLNPIQVFTTTPPIPDLSSVFTVTICWCGLLNPAKRDVQIVFYDGSGDHYRIRMLSRTQSLMTTRNGCVRERLSSPSGPNGSNRVIWVSSTPTDFDAGGGVSFIFGP